MTDHNTQELIDNLEKRIEYAVEQITELNERLEKVDTRTDGLQHTSKELREHITSHKEEIAELKSGLEKLMNAINAIADDNKYELIKIETEIKLIHKDLTTLTTLPSKLNEHILEMQGTKQTTKMIRNTTWVMACSVITFVVTYILTNIMA